MIEFSKLSDNARIWVYTSDRFITEQEKELILTHGYTFLSTWAAHGAKLKAAIEILDDCFIVLGIDQDETSASGCSIDASITFFQRLEKELDISLLDWQNMAYTKNNKINLIKRSEFEHLLKANQIDNDINIYNTNEKTKSELFKNRTTPLSETNFNNLLPIKS